MSKTLQRQSVDSNESYTCDIRYDANSALQSNSFQQDMLRQQGCQQAANEHPAPNISVIDHLVGKDLLLRAHKVTDNVTSLMLGTAVALYADHPAAQDLQADLSIYESLANLVSSEVVRIEQIAEQQFQFAWQQCGEGAYVMFDNTQYREWLQERLILLEDMTKYIQGKSTLVGQQFLPTGKKLMELALQYQETGLEIDIDQLNALKDSLSVLLENKEMILQKLDKNITLAQAQLVFDTIAAVVGFCGGVGPVLTVLTGLSSAGFGFLYEDFSAASKVNTLAGTGASLLAHQHQLAQHLPHTKDLFGVLRNNFPASSAIGNTASVLGVGYDVMGLQQMYESRDQMMATLDRAPGMIDECLKGLLNKQGALQIVTQALELIQSTSILDILANAQQDSQKYAYTMNASTSCFEAAPIH